MCTILCKKLLFLREAGGKHKKRTEVFCPVYSAGCVLMTFLAG
ncbi:hypothetical protein AB434_0922 [Heyndrickxia coagulans]|uniref:Uncharacterized protein n=1 Tax=Heyndrickxia coagulans TaxID=1398 RepID=A0AAN0T2F7_HEYCO|nr:hypothetical protein SB48_HM08orf00363 [Heyndrickxia coagulans]AKN53327.1 hypothetical protein AB434_0922 [Heyndrickxia coagulans]KYC62556.1 hypothetical protein B4100_1607 [Heyndrickxia coagulans]KYC86440.1 hypothetical protein B4096_1549 [Heyndrickxia coagulans]